MALVLSENKHYYSSKIRKNRTILQVVYDFGATNSLLSIYSNKVNNNKQKIERSSFESQIYVEMSRKPYMFLSFECHSERKQKQIRIFIILLT